MNVDLTSLPLDVTLLQRMLLDAIDVVKTRDVEIERLKALVAQLKRMHFGKSSEKQNADQLRLAFEAIEEEIAELTARIAPEPAAADRARPGRLPLPDHLPRIDVRHEPEGCTCPNCGGRLHEIGVDQSEVLEYRPASFEVIRHVRPRFGCRACETITQMPAPSLPIPRGKAGPGLLAHLIVSKYCDHIPLYRQPEIYAREGVEIDRSTLADWAGRSAWLLQPLGDKLAEHVFAAAKIHGDDTPVPVLSPGSGRTKTGRLWVYVRDDRNSGDLTPPAAVFRYSADRKGARPADHLRGFSGYFQADAYSGYAQLYRGGANRVTEVACWAHARRKINDVLEATKGKSPIAAEAILRIGALYAIEDGVRGDPPDRRFAVRQQEAVPKLGELKAWMDIQVKRLAPKSALAKAITYALKRWDALVLYTTDGRLEIDNNRAENSLRGVALGRKNWLFAGSDNGGNTAAMLYSLIESCKLNGINPQIYLADVLSQIAEYPINRIGELLPWAWLAGQHNTLT